VRVGRTGARGEVAQVLKRAAATTWSEEGQRGKPQRAALVRHRAARRERAEPGVRTPWDAARAARIPRCLGVRAASVGPRPREARPRVAHCAWGCGPVAQRGLARPARATLWRGAVRRRPAGIIFPRPCLNTRNSKKLNRSAQSGD
jgi:hypothetical protein